jgi:integrase/recombinase XerD
MSARQRQARALGWDEIKKFIEKAGEGIRATRERALLSMAYDLMARRGELVALEVRDLTFLPDGTGRALIRKSKTDQTGEGSSAYLTRDTVRWLQLWLNDAEIVEGPVFRRLVGRGRVGEKISADAIAQIYKRVAKFVGVNDQDAEAVSGHSIRVGATQDLLSLNIDLGSVMQAGRWKSNRMPMRYGEHVMASRGGIARAAAAQGRDKDREQGAQG